MPSSARLYGLDLDLAGKPAGLRDDYFTQLRRRYRANGAHASNRAYGYVAAS